MSDFFGAKKQPYIVRPRKIEFPDKTVVIYPKKGAPGSPENPLPNGDGSDMDDGGMDDGMGGGIPMQGQPRPFMGGGGMDDEEEEPQQQGNPFDYQSGLDFGSVLGSFQPQNVVRGLPQDNSGGFGFDFGFGGGGGRQRRPPPRRKQGKGRRR